MALAFFYFAIIEERRKQVRILPGESCEVELGRRLFFYFLALLWRGGTLLYTAIWFPVVCFDLLLGLHNCCYAIFSFPMIERR